MSGNYKCHIYILPFFVVIFIIWTYYLYIVAFLGYALNNEMLIYIFLVIYNILYIMLIWSLLRLIFTPRSDIPEQYKLTAEEIKNYNQYNQEQKRNYLTDLCQKKRITIMTRTENGSIRYCKICNQIKPDRTHHCPHCKRCIMKMIHHCPWIGVCIELTNQKALLLTLFYSTSYCVFFVATSFIQCFEYFQDIENKQQYILTVIGFISSACAGIVSLALLLYEAKIMFRNETTMELLQKTYFVNGRHTFNIGWRSNFTEVFGSQWQYWLLPIRTFKGTGLAYQTKELPPELHVASRSGASRPLTLSAYPAKVNSREIIINAILQESDE